MCEGLGTQEQGEKRAECWELSQLVAAERGPLVVLRATCVPPVSVRAEAAASDPGSVAPGSSPFCHNLSYFVFQPKKNAVVSEVLSKGVAR